MGSRVDAPLRHLEHSLDQGVVVRRAGVMQREGGERMQELVRGLQEMVSWEEEETGGWVVVENVVGGEVE